MMRKRVLAFVVVMVLAFVGSSVFGAKAPKSFKDLVGPVQVGPVQCDARGTPCDLPYILWGGEAATFQANGLAVVTKPGSIFNQKQLTFRLVSGDDFVGQVRRYMEGKTPFLRGTLHMIGMASEVISNDPRTQPVVLFQMTWSRGDHLVGKATIKTVADLKGKTIALQDGGPHVGMLEDVLKTAGLGWNDISVVWTKDITGVNGPAEALKKNSRIDAAFAVTPDMIGITGGLANTGSGAEGTIKGAHVVVSTAELTRSIADVYVVRKDWYDAHPDIAAAFAAAYLKGAEWVVEAQANKNQPAYRQLLNYMVGAYPKDTLPGPNDADGLIMDCAFVGHPGNVAFFTEANNANGFAAFSQSAMDMAVHAGYASKRGVMHAPTWNWAAAPFAGYLAHIGEVQKSSFKAEATFAEMERLAAAGTMDDQTIYSFAVNFNVDQNDFPADTYGSKFDEAIKLSQKYTGAAVAIVGHADPTYVLGMFVKTGMANGVLTRRGVPGSYQYFLNGQPLDLAATPKLVQAIEGGTLDRSGDLRAILAKARDLSRERGDAVRASLETYAKRKGATLKTGQFQVIGMGVGEPLIPVPRSDADAAQNRRVEFRLVRVSAEAASPAQFDY